MITTRSMMKPCGCRSSGECTHNIFVETMALNRMVDKFAEEMKRKLCHKLAEGYHGWDDPSAEPVLIEKLRDHIERGKGQEIDIANLAAMLWNLRTP